MSNDIVHLRVRLRRVHESAFGACQSFEIQRRIIYFKPSIDVLPILIWFRLGAKVNQLAAVAVSRLQGELAKDGREPSRVSDEMQEKSISKRVRSFGKAKGKKKLFSHFFFCWFPFFLFLFFRFLSYTNKNVL